MVQKMKHDWENVSVLERGRLNERAYFFSYADKLSALTYDRGFLRALSC